MIPNLSGLPLLRGNPEQAEDKKTETEDDSTKWFRVHRDVKDDQVGLAVVAYTRQWDVHQILHEKGLGQKNSPLQQMYDDEQVRSRRAMLLFFVPLDVLRMWSSIWTNRTKIQFKTTAELPASLFQVELAKIDKNTRSQCELMFVYAPESWETTSADEQRFKEGAVDMMEYGKTNGKEGMIAGLLLDKAELVLKAGLSHIDNKLQELTKNQIIFDRTVHRMTTTLHAACRAVPAEILYRGLDVRRAPIDASASSIAASLESSFFSTSRVRDVAKKFVRDNGVLITFNTSESVVYGIDVDATLPKEWRCYSEYEVIVAPRQQIKVVPATQITWEQKEVVGEDGNVRIEYYRVLTLQILPGEKQKVQWEKGLGGVDPHFEYVP